MEKKENEIWESKEKIWGLPKNKCFFYVRTSAAICFCRIFKNLLLHSFRPNHFWSVSFFFEEFCKIGFPIVLAIFCQFYAFFAFITHHFFVLRHFKKKNCFESSNTKIEYPFVLHKNIVRPFSVLKRGSPLRGGVAVVDLDCSFKK